MLILKILFILAIVICALFLLSLVIYFFNLDMKIAAKMTPVMMKYYDRKKAKKENNLREKIK